MTGDERTDLFNELMRLLPRISIEQPAFMDSLETLNRLLEAASSGTDARQDELLFRALTDFSPMSQSLAGGLLSLRMGLAAGLERQVCLDLALAGTLGHSDVRRLAEERLNRPTGKSLRAEILYLLQCRDERLDGSGPLGLGGKELDPPIRILAAACAYVDRLAAGWSGLRALAFIHGEGSLFDEGSARLLVQVLSVYPLGSYVVLDSGEKGRVVGARPDEPLRPIVCVRLRADGAVVEPPLLYDQGDAPQVASLLAEPWAGVPAPEETGPAWLRRLHERLSSWPQEAAAPLPEGMAGDWGRPSSELARRQEESEREESQRLAAVQADIDRSKAALAALAQAERRRVEEGEAALSSVRRDSADELRRVREDPELKEPRRKLAAQRERLENKREASAQAAAALMQEKAGELQACLEAVELQKRKLERLKEEQEKTRSRSRKALRLRLAKRRAQYQRRTKELEKLVEASASELDRAHQEQRARLAAVQADIDGSKTDLASLMEDQRLREEEGRAALPRLRREAADELRRLRADPELKDVRLRLAAQQKRLADEREALVDAASALLQEKAGELRAFWERINLQRRKLSLLEESQEKARCRSQEALRLRLERRRARHRSRIEEIERRVEAVAAEAEQARQELARFKDSLASLERAQDDRPLAPPRGGETAEKDPRLAAIQADIGRFKATLAALVDTERRRKEDGEEALMNLRRKAANELRLLRANPALKSAKSRLAQEERLLEAQREAIAQALEKGHQAIAARQQRWASEKKSLEDAVIEKRRELEELRRGILEASQRRDQTEAEARRAAAEFEQKAAALLARERMRLAARQEGLQDSLAALKTETEQAARQRAEALEAFQGRREALEEDIRRLRGEWGDLQGLLSADEAEEPALRQALRTALSDLDLRLLEARFALETMRKEASALSQEQERRLKDWERAGRELEGLAQRYEELSGRTEPLLEQWRELAGQGLAGVSAVFREQILSRASELGLWSGRLSEVGRRLAASRAAFESHLFLRCREAGLRAFREGRLDEARAGLRRALSLKPDSEAQNLLARLEGLPERAPEKEDPGS